MEAHKQDWIVSHLDHLSGWRLQFNTSCVWVGGSWTQDVFSILSAKRDHLQLIEKSENILIGREAFHGR